MQTQKWTTEAEARFSAQTLESTGRYAVRVVTIRPEDHVAGGLFEVRYWRLR